MPIKPEDIKAIQAFAPATGERSDRVASPLSVPRTQSVTEISGAFIKKVHGTRVRKVAENIRIALLSTNQKVAAPQGGRNPASEAQKMNATSFTFGQMYATPPADGQTRAITEAASEALRARAQARIVERIQKTGAARVCVVDLD